MAERLLRAHRTIMLVPVIEIGGEPHLLGGSKVAPVTCPLNAPTAAVLNTWLPVTDQSHPLAGIGGNISEAVLDDVDLGLADSDTEEELTITSRGDEQAITFFNIDAALTFLRDEDQTALGTWNMARDLTIAPDIRYGIVDRAVGKHTHTTPFAAGTQVVSIYDVNTDVAQDIIEDRTSIKHAQNFVGTGEVAINVTVG